MKKILLLLPSNSSFLPPLKKAFKSISWQVATFDYRKGDFPIRILRFTPIIGGRQEAAEAINKKILKISRKCSPDLILTVKGETLWKRLLGDLKTQKTKVVNWFPDPMNTWDLAKKIVPFYDYFLHFDPLIVEKLKSVGYKNIYYLPFASEIQKSSKAKKNYDISFIGTYSEFRENYLSNLKKFNLNIWGDPRWYSSSLKKFVRGGRIHQDKMKDIIKKSKININIHFNAPREGANLRTFEVAGCSSFLLTDYVKDIENLFKVGKEIDLYRTPLQMVSKSKYYLNNESLREKIAEAGYKKAKSMHNYVKRVQEMLKIIYG